MGSWQGALTKLVQGIQIGLRTKALQSWLVRNSWESCAKSREDRVSRCNGPKSPRENIEQMIGIRAASDQSPLGFAWESWQQSQKKIGEVLQCSIGWKPGFEWLETNSWEREIQIAIFLESGRSPEKGGERRRKAKKMMRKRRRMSRRLHKPGEWEEEGWEQGHTDSLWRRAMSLGLFSKMKGEQKGSD